MQTPPPLLQVLACSRPPPRCWKGIAPPKVQLEPRPRGEVDLFLLLFLFFGVLPLHISWLREVQGLQSEGWRTFCRKKKKEEIRRNFKQKFLHIQIKTLTYLDSSSHGHSRSQEFCLLKLYLRNFHKFFFSLDLLRESPEPYSLGQLLLGQEPT